MARFRRLPPAPRAAKLLAGKERLLAWALTATDDLIVATPTGLYWPSEPVPEGAAELLPWWRLNKAVWRDDVLSVIAADADEVFLTDRRPVTARLVQPGNVPPVVRKRIEGSIRKTERVSLPSGEVRVVARTVPGKDGLKWLARLEPGNRQTPGLRDEVAQLIARLTEQSDQQLQF